MARRHNGRSFRNIDLRREFIRHSKSEFTGDRGKSPQEAEAKQKVSERLKAEIQRRKKDRDK